MNDDDSTGVILTTLLVSGAILTVRALRAGVLTPRTYASLVIMAVFLLVMGKFWPKVAAAFAILVMVSILLTSEKDITSLLSFTSAQPKGKAA